MASLLTQDKQHDFDLCPESHPTAFDCGRKCCKPSGQIPSWSEANCEGEAIYCSGLACEEYITDCQSYFLLEGTESRAFEGEYYETDYLEANRPVYSSGENCIWWYRAERNWWIGSCENVGTNNGFAYHEKDLDCPDFYEDGWRSKITNETFSINLFESPFHAVVAFVPSKSLTGTAGVNFIKQKRHYRQTCTFKRFGRQERCIKLPHSP